MNVDRFEPQVSIHGPVNGPYDIKPSMRKVADGGYVRYTTLKAARGNYERAMELLAAEREGCIGTDTPLLAWQYLKVGDRIGIQGTADEGIVMEQPDRLRRYARVRWLTGPHRGKTTLHLCKGGVFLIEEGQ